MSNVIVGHINLKKSMHGIGGHFVSLVEALRQLGAEQHVLVRNVTLARRLDTIAGVTVGPVVTTAITAACCMPHVDVVHVHHPEAGQAGLLLTLTRSIPYVLTHRGPLPGMNPVTQSAYRRAAAIVCAERLDASALVKFNPGLRVYIVPDAGRPVTDDEAYVGCRAAARYVRVYQRAAEKWRMPALLL